MSIKNISTANTFGEWLVATQALVTKYNAFEDSANLVADNANTTSNLVITANAVYSNTVNTYNLTANLYANTVILESNTGNTFANTVIYYNLTSALYSNTVNVYADTYNLRNAVFNYVQAAYDTANTVTIQSGIAWNTANSANATSEASLINSINAFTHANAAYIQANSAYNQANSSYNIANNSFVHANASYGQANLAFAYANAALTTSNAAHLHANSAFDTVNVLLSYANTANLGWVTDTSVNGEKFILFVTSNTGNLTNVHTSSDKLKYNPNTGVMTTNVNSNFMMINSTVYIDQDRNISNIKSVQETVFTVSDAPTVDLNPSNGTIQIWTLGANRTPFANSFQNGQSLTLMVDDGTSNTITWSTMNVSWIGNTAPSLATTGYTVIELWKANNKIYGARVGDVAQ